MNPLRLEQMAYFDAGALGLIDLAAALGVPAVSFWTSGAEALDGARQVTAADVPAIRARLDERGVVADSIEVFRLTPSLDPDQWCSGLELGAELGARTAAVLNVELVDQAQAADALAAFAAAAGEFGLTAGLEPIASGATRTLRDAEQLVRRSGSAARIVVDVLHLVRTGQEPGAVRDLDPTLIVAAQISDGPASMSPDGRRNESAFDRLAPGEGDFPLVEFLAALPADAVLGVEVPMRTLQQAGWSPERRARRAVDGTRAIQELAAAGRDQA